MSLIQTPWTSQPQQAVGIDWGNPITMGLVDVIDMRYATPVSVILGTPTKTFGTRPVVGVTGRGVASDSTAGFGGWYFDRTDGKYAPSGDQTFVYVGNLTSASTGYAGIVVTADGTGANNAVSWQYGNASDILSFFNATQVTLSGATASTYDGSDSVFALVVKSGVSATHYKNGIQVVSTGTAASTPSYGTSRLVVFGERLASSTYASKGKSNLVAHFRRSLSHAEIRSISQNPWQIFKPIPRRIFASVVAGGGVTINAGTGNAVAAGINASVSQAASIAAGVGNAAATGLTASIAQQYALSAGVGNAAAAGLTATITASGLTTISCTTGNSAAAGATATVNSSATITCSVGNAAAAGLTAALDIAFTILANVGNATGAGLSATIHAATGISCGVANAIAAGLTASITNNAPLTDSEKLDLILDILSNRQTLNPATGVYTLYADDGVTVLKTAQAWEDAAGTIPYRGRALQRLDSMG